MTPLVASMGRVLAVGALLAVLIGCHRQPAPDSGRNAAGPAADDAAPSASAAQPEFAVDAVSTEEGEATWYDVPSNSLARRRAWPEEMTGASDHLPPNTYVRVHRISNGKSIVVRITDHGIHQKGTIIDLDRAGAEALDMIRAGRVQVKLEVLALKHVDVAGPSPGTAQAQTSPAKATGASEAEEKAAAATKAGGEAGQ